VAPNLVEEPQHSLLAVERKRVPSSACLLDELARTSIEKGDVSGQSGVIWPWRNQMHLKFKVPGSTDEERLRLQFLAFGGQPLFTIEAR
jgi:hypothetical protein